MRRDRFTRQLALFLIMLLLAGNVMISSADSLIEPLDQAEAIETLPVESDEEALPPAEEPEEVIPQDFVVSETPTYTYQESMDIILHKHWVGVPEGQTPSIEVQLYASANPEVVIDTQTVTYTGVPTSVLVWEDMPLRDEAGNLIDYAVREIDSIYFDTTNPVVSFVQGELQIVEPQSSMYWNVEQASYGIFRPVQNRPEVLIWTLNPVADKAAFIEGIYNEALAAGQQNAPLIQDLIDSNKPKIFISGNESYDFNHDDDTRGMVSVSVNWDEDGSYYMAELYMQTPSTWTHFAIAQSNKLVEITNIYSYVAEGQWTPVLSKRLSGRDLKAGEFTFELLEGDEVIQTATNAADGSVTFEPIVYDQTAIGQVFTYTVREVKGELGGVTYDETVYTVEVTITDNGDGTLTATPVFNATPVFENEYAASGKWQPEVKKTLKGRDLKAGEFSFVLLEGEEVLQTKQNDADGRVLFDEIVYTKPGVYEYTILEVKGDLPDMVYDEVVHTIVVTVTDNGDGTLNIKPDYDVPLSFVNKYVEKIDITATKKWVGGPEKKPIIQFQLYRNGEKLGEVVELDGVTSYTWKDLPK